MGNIIGAISVAQRFEPGIALPIGMAKYKLFFTDTEVVAIRLDALTSATNILGVAVSGAIKLAMTLNDWEKIVTNINTNKIPLVEYDNLSLPEASAIQKRVIPYDKIKQVEVQNAGRDKTPEKLQSGIRFITGFLTPGDIFLIPGSGLNAVKELLNKTPLANKIKVK